MLPNPSPQRSRPGPNIRSWRGGLAAALLLLVALTACIRVEATATPAPTGTPDPRIASAPTPAAPGPTATPASPDPEPAATATPSGRKPAPEWVRQAGGSVYFLRAGDLWRFSTESGAEERLFPNVTTFAVSADGAWVAAVRRDGGQSDLWIAGKDWADAEQVTDDDRVETGLAWSPDNALAFASTTAPAEPAANLGEWATACQASTIMVWEAAEGVRELAPGCDPAWSPDGLRVAFTAPPRVAGEPGQPVLPEDNSIDLVNAAGDNRWSPVRSSTGPEGIDPGFEPAQVVHEPAWTPDGGRLVYGRFAGYALLCDHTTIEAAGSFDGEMELLWALADQLLGASVDAGGRYLALDLAVCNAPGFAGYNTRAVHILDLQQPGRVESPVLAGGIEAGTEVAASEVWRQQRAHSPAWAPDGTLLAHVAPPDWPDPDGPTPDPDSPYNSTAPGRLVVRDVETGGEASIVADVDFGSPVAWTRTAAADTASR